MGNSRPGPDIHWHEGMLLMPQHFQEFGNALARRLQDAALTRGPFAWGVYDIQLRIAGNDLTLAACDLVLKDGLRVIVSSNAAEPGNTVVSQASFKSSFAALAVDRPLEVWFGIPDRRVEVSVVDKVAGRFELLERDLHDENTDDPGATTEVRMRYLRGKLFFGSEPRVHHTCIKIAEIVRGETGPVLAGDFVPPLLDITANASLQERLSQVHKRLLEVNEAVGNDVASRPFSMLLQAGGNPEALFKLNATNSLLPAVGLLSRSQGVHPLQTYTALCTLVGTLAVFRSERRCPVLPGYDHDDLRGCFGKVLEMAMLALKLTWSVSWDVCEFGPVEGNERVLRCNRPKDWIDSPREQFLAASADAPPATIEHFITKLVRLMGAPDYLGEVRKKAIPCVRLGPPPRSPDKLPPPEGWLYFQVERIKTAAERLRVYDESESVYLVMEADKLPNLKVSLYGIRVEKGN